MASMKKSHLDLLEFRHAQDALGDYEQWRQARESIMEEAMSETSLARRRELFLQASMAEERAQRAWVRLDRSKRQVLKDGRLPEWKLQQARVAIAQDIASEDIIPMSLREYEAKNA